MQGVFFRASTAREAERLGLSGHAINRPDGTVEVLACGAKAQLDELEAWLEHGPRMAAVTSVVRQDLDCRDYDDRGSFVTG